jgi:hypothetical protein
VIECVSSNLTIRNLTIWAPGDSPNTDGIVPGMYVGCQILLLEPFVANQKHKERSKIIVSWRLVFFPVNLVLKILLAVSYFEISATAILTF